MAAAIRWPWAHEPQPTVDLGRRRQDDGHGLGINRRDDRVRLRRQEAEQLMGFLRPTRSWDLHAAPGCPQPGEGEERPILAQRESHRRLPRLRVGVFTKRCRRDDAAILLPKPRAPMRASKVANVRHRLAAELWRSGHSPARHDNHARRLPRRERSAPSGQGRSQKTAADCQCDHASRRRGRGSRPGHWSSYRGCTL